MMKYFVPMVVMLVVVAAQPDCSNPPTQSEPCSSQTDGYCSDNGCCFYVPAIGQKFCRCDSGWSGPRCNEHPPSKRDDPEPVCSDPPGLSVLCSPPEIERSYCSGNGCCFYVKALDMKFCRCDSDWTGERCDEKVIPPNVGYVAFAY